ncbi:MAG: (d)CMP kinase [Firmicutes bacterium]|nr:(d)CMP kinase [Bacillota bacterium]
MLRVAIDGPGGAGKSTIAKLIADMFSLDYVDTGAMYRAIALKVSRAGLDADDEEALKQLTSSTKLDFDGSRILLDGEDVSDLIRTPEVSMWASKVSQRACVRKLVSDLSSHMAQTKSLVMDGRDIGTNVIKDAEVKVFLSASSIVRAKRRYDQLIQAGKEADLDSIREQIEERDEQDINRDLNPLTQAEDAVYLDTSDMTIDEVVEFISDLINDAEVK